ncbi:EAL domain-containing protein [Oceanimonas smirnovii]|uniref:EAL domain-containing protein n=1 Tax=Oceanimonas smirnovii TaxID=264574 RepID=UPI003AB07C46
MTQAHNALAMQQAIQDQIARHALLGDILDSIIKMVAQQLPSARISLMMLDSEDGTLSLTAGHGLSDGYCRALQRLPVGPAIGACGVSAYNRDVVITENIEQDPNWVPFLQYTRAEGVASCWSAPVLTSNHELLGTFAIYHHYPRSPSLQERSLLIQSAGLLALAIARQRDRQALAWNEQRFRSLFTHHPDAVFELDLQGYLLDANRALTQITGFSLEQIKGRHYEQFMAEENKARAREAFKLVCEGQPQRYELTAYNANGERYWLDVTNLPIMVDGRIMGIYGIGRDITLQQAQAAELHLLKRGIEATPNGVVMADATLPDMPLVYVNKAFLNITGYLREDVLGRNCRFLQGSNTDPQAVSAIKEAISACREHECTLLNYRKDGTPFWNQLIIAPVFNSLGQCTHYIGIQQDITKQRENEEALRFQRSHDVLTGLPNRVAFHERLTEYYRLCRQQSRELAVLALNLDGFKVINDALGHYAGDQLLKSVGQQLAGWLNSGDMVARLGGDDFGILLPNRDEAGIIKAAESLLSLLEQPFFIKDQRLYLSASIGVATSDEKTHDSSLLIQHARLAMREAKRQGYHHWQWYSGSITSHIHHHINLRREIEEALEQGQFIMHYQPLVDARTGEIRSLEALIRWHHPERGLIFPGDFIPLAEETGKIIGIGHWVLRQACKDITIINASRNTQPLSVAVNISPLSFQRGNIFSDIKHILQETCLAPHLLELELTEGVLMSGAETAIDNLRAIRELGVRVAIDDFGTGFSSLSYLRKLPINQVKLDRSFISDITVDKDNAAIVQGVITMAHHLGLEVVAEGVETKEQQQDLIMRGCDLLQGFRFSRPVPLENILRLPSMLPE